MKKQSSQKTLTNPKRYFERIVEDLGRLAVSAKASNNPVVVLIDESSPWATKTKMLLSRMSIENDLAADDGFLKGCSNWEICEIAARSAPTIAEYLRATLDEPSQVRIVLFYQTKKGLRIACTDFSLCGHPYH